jgi:ATP phosphoribosyltransferase
MADLITTLTSTGSPLVALQGAIIVILGSVIAYTYKYMKDNTVPRWAWENLIDRIVERLKQQESVVKKNRKKMSKLKTIIDERL